VDLRVAPISFEQQDVINRAASNLQVPSQVETGAFDQYSPFARPGENFYLVTQELDQTSQTLRPPPDTYLPSVPEHYTQHPAVGAPTYDIVAAAMYGATSSCLPLPDKAFGFTCTPLQWANCFAGLVPNRQSLTNQPGLSKWLFLTESVDANSLAGEYRDSLVNFENRLPVSEEILNTNSSTNASPFQPYSDDAPTQMSPAMTQVQVSLSIPQVNITRC
jgi:hypothetical protein